MTQKYCKGGRGTNKKKLITNQKLKKAFSKGGGHWPLPPINLPLL